MGQVLRPARVTHTIKPGVISLPHGRWANIDEKTGIDPAGADNVLYEQVATGLGTSGWNSGVCNVEKWHGKPLIADARVPLRLPDFGGAEKRSAERRVGKECGSQVKVRGEQDD